MNCVFPIASPSSDELKQLRDIYDRCDRSDLYEDDRYARNTNVFIDSTQDFTWIVDRLLRRYDIDYDDIENFYKDQRCNGINFNVLTNADWVKEHRDYNPTKLNILVSDERCSEIVFPDFGERWAYETPAILKVGMRHRVDNLHLLTKPRIMLQVFLRKPFMEYVERLGSAVAG